MADIHIGRGTEEIPLQQLGPISNEQPEQQTSSSQVLPVQSSTQDAPDLHPLHTISTVSSIQSVRSAPRSQVVPIVENETSSPEAGVSASTTTTIEAPSRTNSVVAVTSPPEAQNPLRQDLGHSTIQHATRTKSLSLRLLDLKYTIMAIMIVGFTASLMFTADYQHAPLGSLGASGGILILNFLGKATDYSLAASAELMWETLQLGPLLRRREQLLTYLALAPDASFIGWVKILLLRRSSDEGRATKRDAWWEKPRFWSFMRLISWAALQFPGLIVLAIANPQTKYYPTSWTQVSGGIGVFDSNIAASGAYLPNLLAGLITTDVLRDNTRTFQVDPISEACIAAGGSCGSYLIFGGLGTISPWPFQQSDDRYVYYMTSGEPVYQIDFWIPTEPVIWSDSACKLYGFTHLALKFCIDYLENVQGQIIAGWRDCIGDIPPSGSCAYRNGSSEASQVQSIAMSIYRRTATITASRKTSTALDVTDLSNPIVQKLSPSNFTTAFDAVLLPWSNDTTSDFCFTQSPQYLITTYLASSLSNAVLAPFIPIASDSLRNLFATAIYLFNPLTSGIGIQIALDTVSMGLDAANYFQGSLSVGVEQVVPAQWTALAYIGVASALLGLVILSQALTAREDMPVTSSFALVDALQLKCVKRNERGDEAEVGCLTDTFEGVEAGDNRGIIGCAGEVRVIAREENTAGNGAP